MRTSSVLLFLLLIAFSTFSQGAVFKTDDGAIRGYDPVAYFTEEKPVKGVKSLTYKWKSADWYFSSQKNRDLFKADPQKYAPQYGGFCAYGVSRNYKVKTEPDAWTVVDGKLYLNYDTDVMKTWNKDRANYIRKANTNWLKLEGKQ